MLVQSLLWPPHEKSWLIGKDSDAGRDWGQEEKGTTEDEMAGWHHWLDGHWVWVNSGSWWWTGRPGVLRFMGLQRSDTTERLNWLNWTVQPIKYNYIENSTRFEFPEGGIKDLPASEIMVSKLAHDVLLRILVSWKQSLSALVHIIFLWAFLLPYIVLIWWN